jgi:hypothetical protein
MRAKLAAVRFRWTEAADWAREQDERRAAEQVRFANSRALAELERVWALPAATRPLTPESPRLPDAEPFRRS